MTVADFVKEAIEKLKTANIDNPQLDARLLIGHILHLDRGQLLSHSESLVSEKDTTAIQALIERRIKHEPVARIIGMREFWGLPFGLNEATLEPRPDSETLIEAVLKFGLQNPRILDLGTGSGCLLLSLLHEMPGATGLGIDIEKRAVEQAEKNAQLLNLSGSAVFETHNWLEGLSETFDVIISNPPYIATNDIASLAFEVKSYDPLSALDGGEDGLAPYRFLIPQLKAFLKPGGIVAFEMGQGQVNEIEDFLQQAGFVTIQRHQDLGGIDRCLTAQLSPTYPDN